MFKGVKRSASLVQNIIKTSKLTKKLPLISKKLPSISKKPPTVSIPLKDVIGRTKHPSIFGIKHQGNVWIPDTLRGETFTMESNEENNTELILISQMPQGTKPFNFVISDEIKERIQAFLNNEITKKAARTVIVLGISYAIYPGVGLFIFMDVDTLFTNDFTEFLKRITLGIVSRLAVDVITLKLKDIHRLWQSKKDKQSKHDIRGDIEQLLKDVTADVVSRLAADAIKQKLKTLKEKWQSKKDKQSIEDGNSGMLKDEVDNAHFFNIIQYAVLSPELAEVSFQLSKLDHHIQLNDLSENDCEIINDFLYNADS